MEVPSVLPQPTEHASLSTPILLQELHVYVELYIYIELYVYIELYSNEQP